MFHAAPTPYNVRANNGAPGGRSVAFDFFRRKPKLDPETAARVPPGQYLTEKWPVLHYGGVPKVSQETWNLKIFGLIDGEPLTLTYDEVLALPQTGIAADIHCVTRWSRLDTKFEGVRFTDLLELVHVQPDATHAMIHAEQGFTANLSLEDLAQPNVLLAHTADGKPLEPAHGGPMRLVVPHLYFWKSAKWVRGIRLQEHDQRGFWESFGYHDRGDPWKEQRYQGD
jgi:DMSO/TMAO reductase YedYZ molybdopterin-dependent catalytic subunit